MFIAKTKTTSAGQIILGTKLIKKDPVYIWQYLLPYNHKLKSDEQVDEWLKMDSIQPSYSKCNSA
jgi:hypothetical protein